MKTFKLFDDVPDDFSGQCYIEETAVTCWFF